jgi:hypothetical protein
MAAAHGGQCFAKVKHNADTKTTFACVLQRFTDDELDFQKRILYRSGLGDETYVPPCEFWYS